jgi:NADH-quinone oxidoreductase subunit N
MPANLNDLYTILPVTTIVVWACVLLLVDLFFLQHRKGVTALLAAAGLAVALGLSIALARNQIVGFSGMAVLDGYAIFFNALFCVTGLLAVMLAYDYLRRMNIERGEYYVLILFSVAGMMLMSQAADLIVVFLALELLSIPLYVLAAFAYPRVESEESGVKYFLLGAFAAGFFVYGTALVFGSTGTTGLAGIVASVGSGAANLPLLLAGSALILVGLGFKVAVVPFHMWTPDVYQGAPTAVTAFMSAGAKAAGFAALLRVFVIAFPSLSANLTPVLWAISAATMIAGNLIAIPQTNIKRMLAYSSIAQAGYVLMGFVPYGQPDVVKQSISAALFFLFAYTITSFGAWAVVIALERAEGNPSTGSGQRGLEIADYAGLGRRYPALAAAMTVFMLSLTGVPPTLGFVGKFYLFSAVVQGGFYWLAVIGVLTSLISAYYYLRVVVTMYMREGQPEVVRETWLNLTWGITSVLTVLLALAPQALINWASQAVLRLF